MITTPDLHWLAGWLEGEGTFYLGKQSDLLVVGATTDEDVAHRACDILGGVICGPYSNKRRPSSKPHWQVRVHRRSEAAGWMMTLYSIMGRRRREKIRECLMAWRAKTPRPHPNSLKTHCLRWHEFTSENTRVGKNGGRLCRTCDRLRKARLHRLLDWGRCLHDRRRARPVPGVGVPDGVIWVGLLTAWSVWGTP